MSPNLRKITVEAEIKVVVHIQRVREAESRIETQSAKWTAEGTVKGIYKRGLQNFRLDIDL